MKQNSRLQRDEAHTQGQSETTAQARQQNANLAAAEFETPEALLRHDAANTPVPPQVAERLRASLDAEPVKPASWWSRFFRR